MKDKYRYRKRGLGIILLILLLVCTVTFSSCSSQENIQTDGYPHLIGVSLTNVMEPWLNHLVQVLTAEVERSENINIIFRDGAGSTEKQVEDIETLMEYGVDLLIVVPDGSSDLDAVMEKVFKKIPIVVLGVSPPTDAYTTVIQVDDEEIGHLAGEYILEELYEEGNEIVVMQGVEKSPISQKRLKGFQDTVKHKIPEEKITYYAGDWLKDQAELRMKDYLVTNKNPDIVFAFNDEMAYGAYLACQQFRVKENGKRIGVDGFEGESAGLKLLEKGVLNATIQSPDFGSLAFDTAMEILEGKEVRRNITIVPEIITGKEKSSGLEP